MEISPEQAVLSGWDEVWRGNWIVGRDSDMGCEKGIEETRSVEQDRGEIQGGSRVSVS